ncbi:hypothetical protein LAU_0168 [Lausannevirus]|uniref:Uncharacterized protein n=2 Tax=Lausannevirus TaxID=999883 RepID=A0A0N9P8P3_9VIRU|nr:hypothetical protein LAU_0168 [Lausannevirus]AEA07019.1 hypothetical protein LAU_0168 [Lausannevirus]ALH06845.1 hypothetical protein PMV_147 [Port-miou virus]
MEQEKVLFELSETKRRVADILVKIDQRKYLVEKLSRKFDKEKHLVLLFLITKSQEKISQLSKELQEKRMLISSLEGKLSK